MKPLLRCTDIKVAFGGLFALDGVSFEVPEASVLGLIGPNGSGKTTFFNAITGIVETRSGKVEFCGKDITGLSSRHVYHHGITRTFQRSRLCLSLSVFDNVVVGLQSKLDLGLTTAFFNRARFRRELDANVEAVSRLLGKFSPKLPARIFDPVGGLNMIDRRRVEVCRALIAAPRLVLMDEPSAGMTHEETHEFMDDVLQVRQGHPGMSIVIIEHQMDVVKRVAQRCVVLNYGKKVAEGTYDEVVADPWVQRAYLGNYEHADG